MVVIERSAPPKGGRAKEVVGFVNPLTKESNVKKERIKHWLSVGAQPSDTVHNILVKEGIVKAEKKAVHATSKKEEEKEAQTEEKAEVEETEKQQPEQTPSKKEDEEQKNVKEDEDESKDNDEEKDKDDEGEEGEGE